MSQEELDEECATDETVHNEVTSIFATPDGTEIELSDFADVDVECDPSYTIVKTVTDVGGDGPNGVVDEAGDVITYQIVIENTGNVTLDLVSIVDELEGAGVDIGTVVESISTNGELDVGETWTYSFTETVSQEELDEECATDETVHNEVTSIFAAPDGAEIELSDFADVDVECDPNVSIIKNVKTDISGVFVAADDASKPQAGINSIVTFEVILTNTGNITLTGVTLEDVLDGSGLDYNTINLGGEALVYADFDGDGVLDVDGGTWNDIAGSDQIIDFDLSPDAVITVYYSYDSAIGNHVNVATVTTDQQVTDNNEAGYYVLPSEDCVGVGTPGFWGNNGYVFWDGIVDNQGKHEGQPGFADGELVKPVGDINSDGVVDAADDIDTNEDSVVDAEDKLGLLLGDYNNDGIENNGEDTIFISLEAAQMLIDASNRQLNGKQADGVWILGRDTVASWLNYLANGDQNGNCFGQVDDDGLYDPMEALNDAVDWLKSYGDKDNDGMITVSDLTSGPKVKTNSDAWQNDGGSTIHSALDQYNNTGYIGDTMYCCDRDDANAIEAMTQVNEWQSSLLLQNSIIETTNTFDDLMMISTNQVV